MRMSLHGKLTLSILSLFLAAPFLRAQEGIIDADVDIPYKRFVLDNGLRLIVSEDNRAPIVAVNVWYHVGSKNEKEGKTGFAHLFEHLMFNGSENFNDDYFKAINAVGATDANGTTNKDRTNYFQNVPVHALDQVLWLESDRMGHLLGAIDQARLDEQRGVVQNEKRQGENSPYGREWELLSEAMWPKGHPYSWTTIGSMEDLDAATLDDVHEWFETYYGAANAVVAVVGDVKAEEVLEKVKHYFGDIEPGPPLTRPEVNVARRTNDSRSSYMDRVPEARIVQVWNTPQVGSAEEPLLDIASLILAEGKNSRLYKLVYEDQVATTVGGFHYTQELAGMFYLRANVRPGESVQSVEDRMNALVREFVENGPTDEEVERAKAEIIGGFLKGIERIGGFGGKSDILASSEVFYGSPDGYKEYFERLRAATAEDVANAAREWISSGKHTLVAYPFPDYSVATEGADRSKLPDLGEAPEVAFPELESYTLENGLEIILARREGSPVVVADLIVDAGFAADPAGKSGLTYLTTNLMDEGAGDLSPLELEAALTMLGAELMASSDVDASYVRLETLEDTFAESMTLLATVVQAPAFAEKEFDRLKREQIEQISRTKANPMSLPGRLAPLILYGEGHPYHAPRNGIGMEETVNKLTLDDVKGYYRDWFRPNNAKLIVVGNVSMEQVRQLVSKELSDWESGQTPKKNVQPSRGASAGVIYLVDRPGAQQSVVASGYLVKPYGEISEVAADIMNRVLGGNFVSRINMNLREDKHWSYGARSVILDAKGERMYISYAPVQSDKTAEAVLEIARELKDFVGERQVSEDEFTHVLGDAVLQLAGQWETNRAVASSLRDLVKFDLPRDYYQTLSSRIQDLELGDVHNIAKQLVRPDDLVWLVVGDARLVRPGLEELGIGEVILIDGDGKRIE